MKHGISYPNRRSASSLVKVAVVAPANLFLTRIVKATIDDGKEPSLDLFGHRKVVHPCFDSSKDACFIVGIRKPGQQSSPLALLPTVFHSATCP
jgi:hypothetical protein